MRSHRRLALRREHLAELSPGTLSRAAAGVEIMHIRSVDYCLTGDDRTCTFCEPLSLPKNACQGTTTIIPVD